MTFYICLLSLWFSGAAAFGILFTSCIAAYCKPRLLLSITFMKVVLISYYFVYLVTLVLLIGSAFNKFAQECFQFFGAFKGTKFMSLAKHSLEHTDHPPNKEANSFMEIFKLIFVAVFVIILVLSLVLMCIKIKISLMHRKRMEDTQRLSNLFKQSLKETFGQN